MHRCYCRARSATEYKRSVGNSTLKIMEEFYTNRFKIINLNKLNLLNKIQWGENGLY